ncbi:MAG TPA: ATP-binding protein [Alphaproteobacteria bacterium]|nr:ATP-binding protein [Alphaproteobacteria bacterium]
MQLPLIKRGESVIKQFLPRTLLVRALLIVVIPLILLQVVTAYVFYERHWDTISWRLSTALAGDIASYIEIFDRNSDPESRAFLGEMAYRNMALVIAWHPNASLPRPIPEPGDSLTEQALARALDDYVRRPYTIEFRPSAKKVHIEVELPSGVLYVSTTSKRLYSTTTYIFLLWMVGTSLILFAVATLFMRNQVRPIRRLAEAADRFGKGQDVPDFKLGGAAEVRLAAAAFKLMRARIERQIAQRTEMLAGVSHDLGTVLTRMKLQLAMLGDSPELSALKADVVDMEKMVEAYLAFARGESAEAPEETDLSALIEEMASGFRHDGTTVTLDVAKGIVVPLRQASFKRCLMNVLANATRHARHIWIAARRNGQSVEIEVDDDGPGIPADQREAVFKPFFRLDPSRNLETGGAGLGLTIARDVIRRHGGDIVLGDSARGGLNVTLRIPV